MAAAHHGGVEDWYARAIAFALRASRIGSNRIRPFGAWFSAWLQMATCRMISTTTASSARHVHLLRGIRNMCVPKPSSNDDDNTKQHRNNDDDKSSACVHRATRHSTAALIATMFVAECRPIGLLQTTTNDLFVAASMFIRTRVTMPSRAMRARRVAATMTRIWRRSMRPLWP